MCRKLRLKFFILVVLAISLIACSDENRIDVVTFDNKNEAVENFIKERTVRGSVTEFNIGGEERLILFEERDQIYYMAELSEIEGKFTVNKISSGVKISNISGAMWEFNTLEKNKYTIKIAKSEEDADSLFIKEIGLYVNIVNEKRTYYQQEGKNLIHSYEVLSAATN